jgi:hypothetical protein
MSIPPDQMMGMVDRGIEAGSWAGNPITSV